jgi:hypothetical protein
MRAPSNNRIASQPMTACMAGPAPGPPPGPPRTHPGLPRPHLGPRRRKRAAVLNKYLPSHLGAALFGHCKQAVVIARTQRGSCHPIPEPGCLVAGTRPGRLAHVLIFIYAPLRRVPQISRRTHKLHLPRLYAAACVPLFVAADGHHGAALPTPLRLFIMGVGVISSLCMASRALAPPYCRSTTSQPKFSWPAISQLDPQKDTLWGACSAKEMV